MKIIRKSTFETNSSSTHAIVISNEAIDWSTLNIELYSDNLCFDSLLNDNPDRDVIKFFNFGRYSDMDSLIRTDLLSKLTYLYLISERKDLGSKFYENYYNLLNILSEYKKTYDKIKDKISDPRYIGDVNKFDKYLNKICTSDNVDKLEIYLEVDNYEEIPEFLNYIYKNEDNFINYALNPKNYITVSGDEYLGYYFRKIGFSTDYEHQEEYFEQVDRLAKKENFKYYTI